MEAQTEPESKAIVDEADLVASRLAGQVRAAGVARFQGMPSDADWRPAYEGLGAAGLIGLHWDARHGGRGLPPLVSTAVEERFGYHWLPLSSYLLSVKTIGNALLHFARPELADRFLPDIAAGSLVFCQGFSEPGAGSDLADLATRGRVVGDRIVVSGHKIWTSSVAEADFIYLAVRTDPDLARHRGLSVVIAEMSSPGIHFVEHSTVGGGTLGEVFLDEVSIPADQVVGTLGGGWEVLMGTLDHERVTSEKVGVALWLLDQLDAVATPHDRPRLATLRGAALVARLHGRHATSLLAARRPAAAASSMAKLSIATLLQSLGAAAVQMLGPRALIEAGPRALFEGRVASFARAVSASTIAGGASEIQRLVIARQGLSCPR